MLNFSSIASVSCLGLHLLVGVYCSQYLPRIGSPSKTPANKWQAGNQQVFISPLIFVQLSEEVLKLIPPRASDRHSCQSCLRGNLLTPERQAWISSHGKGRATARTWENWKQKLNKIRTLCLVLISTRPHSPHIQKRPGSVSWFYPYCFCHWRENAFLTVSPPKPVEILQLVWPRSGGQNSHGMGGEWGGYSPSVDQSAVTWGGSCCAYRTALPCGRSEGGEGSFAREGKGGLETLS